MKKPYLLQRPKHLYILVFLFIGFSLFAKTPAFPGAEGHGRYTTGGRGGDVYYVTSLEDTDTNGTLRYAVSSSSRFSRPLTVLFKVSGTIRLTSTLRINKPNLTIAGQSAPGDGVCLRGFPVQITANNVIIRFLRFRMGDAETISASGADALEMRGYSNVIIDHCSMSWCTDECVSIYGNQNTTLQWCIISESLRLSKHDKGPHGYGSIWGGQKASFLHNLLAHHDSRNPRLGPSPTSTAENEQVDMRNNVIYNWCGNGTYGAEAMNVNMVNNYYKPGPATPTGSKRGRIISIDKKTNNSMPAIENIWGKFYIDGNVVDDGKNDTNCRNATNDNWTYGVYNQFASQYGTVSATDKAAMRLDKPIFYDEVITFDARTGYERVLSYAGASFKRDSYDERIVNETKTGTAAFKGLSEFNGQGGDYKSVGYPKWGIIDSQQDLKPSNASGNWSSWPTLNTVGEIVDGDNDGMPDQWEKDNNLNSNSSSDRNAYALSSEYTNLEVYLNSLVEDLVQAQRLGGVTSTEVPVSNRPVLRVIQSSLADRIELISEEVMTSASLFSTMGQCLIYKEIAENNAFIDLSSLSRGFYFVYVRFKNGQNETIKLIR